MTPTKKWALALFLVLLSLSGSEAQTIDNSTGNLINNNNWLGIGARAPDPNDCCTNPAGSMPLYDTNTNTIKFSYGQATVQQSIAVSQALAAAGSGVQVNGYTWGYDLRNMNGHGGQGGVDTITESSYLKNSSGVIIASASHAYNTSFDWTTFSGTQILASPYAVPNVGNVGISFTGKDGGYWAGLYGPEVRNVSLKVNYGVDPCVTNAAYGPNCAGFNNVVTSNNLIPNPSAWSQNMTQAYAVNTALQSAGVGATVHGINYGFNWYVGGAQCTSVVLWIFCDGWTNSNVNVNVSVTNSSGQTIYNKGYGYSGENVSGSLNVKYLFPSSMNQTLLGNVTMSSSGWGDSTAGNFRSSLIYTADPCNKDPLYSSSCNGYGAAFAANMNKNSTSTNTTTTTVPSTTTDSTTSSSPTVNVGGVQLSSTGTISAPDNIPQALKDVQAVTQQSQSSVTTSSQQSNKSTPNMSLIMSVINQVQANDKATQTQAVQNAQRVVATSSAAAQEQANQVVESLNVMSQASSQASIVQISNKQTSMPIVQQNTSVVQLQPPTAANEMSYMAPIQPITLAPQQSSGQLTFGSANVAIVLLPPQILPSKFESKQQEVDASTTLFNTPMNIGSSVNDLFASKLNFESSQSEQASDTVKKNVTPNDLAGGVDIASIALTPKGFEAYSFVLRDANFYKVEAIYKDQKTIDNARAFRLLSSDKLHQEMVDQQYGR